MSIYTFYLLRCDGCTLDLRHAGNNKFSSLLQAEEVAIARGWSNPAKKHHFCDKCTEKRKNESSTTN